jgi:hypothetical protein
MARTGSIYALCDKDGTPYYVGKTVQSPGIRLGEHRRETMRRGRDSHCHKMTRSLIERGAGPAVWVLESRIRVERLARREAYWIAYCEGAGFALLNYNGGGSGGEVMGEAERRRQAERAAMQPRDIFARFLPMGAPDMTHTSKAYGSSLDVIPF